MVTQELIDTVALKFQQGENGKKIREYLMSQGYEEGDINSAIAEIQKAAFMQIPAYKFIYEKWHQWEANTANLSTGGIVLFFTIVSLVLGGIALLLYMTTDPLGKQAIARDEERKSEVSMLQESLAKYYQTYRAFPASLSQLVPAYLQQQLTDPRSEDEYEYILADDRQTYQLCMVFELQPKDCITVDANNFDSSAFVPQSSADTTSQFVIKGFVYLDVNKNGRRDGAAEPAQRGVGVRAIVSGGKSVCETVTDNSGNFSCRIFTAGAYSLYLNLAPGYVASGTNPQAVTFDENSPKSTDVLLGILATER